MRFHVDAFPPEQLATEPDGTRFADLPVYGTVLFGEVTPLSKTGGAGGGGGDTVGPATFGGGGRAGEATAITRVADSTGSVNTSDGLEGGAGGPRESKLRFSCK